MAKALGSQFSRHGPCASASWRVGTVSSKWNSLSSPTPCVRTTEVSSRSTYRIRVDMSAFGRRTPKTKCSLQGKRIFTLTTCRALAETMLDKVCPQNHEHTPVAGRTRQIGGGTVAVSKFAGSYCAGFAKFVARHMLGKFQGAFPGDMNVEPGRPLTQKCFKTSAGQPQTPYSHHCPRALRLRHRRLPCWPLGFGMDCT